MMTDINGLYTDGDRYHAMYTQTQDLPYWEAQLPKDGDCLEIGCGTGRVLLHLASKGFNVSGLDNAPAMLETTHQRAQSASFDIPLYTGDMRDFNLNRQFDAIFISNNTIGHLRARDDIEGHFASIAKHLKPNGHYLLDYFVPDPSYLVHADQRERLVFHYDHPDDGAKINVYESYRYDHATQIKEAIWTHKRGSDVIDKHDLHLRMFFPQELDSLLHYNDFEVMHKFGRYDGIPFDRKAAKQLIVARKR